MEPKAKMLITVQAVEAAETNPVYLHYVDKAIHESGITYLNNIQTNCIT